MHLYLKLRTFDSDSRLPWQPLTPTNLTAMRQSLQVSTFLRTPVGDNGGFHRAKRLHRRGALPLARRRRFSA